MPVSLIIFLYVPLISLFGLDPVWESRFSFFSPTLKVDSSLWFILGLLVFYYLDFKRRLNPEYIGRD
jgi:hypothetical protein